jgi:hypothetical protein
MGAPFLLFALIKIFFTPLSWAPKEITIVHCLVCENANCPAGTMSPKGHCYKALYSNYCKPECKGADWTGSNPPPNCVGYPKLAEFGTKPASCGTTSASSGVSSSSEWYCTSSIGDRYYSKIMQCQGLQDKDGGCNFTSMTAGAMNCMYYRVERAQKVSDTPAPQKSLLNEIPIAEGVGYPVSQDNSSATSSLELEKQQQLAEEQAKKAAELAKLIEQAKKETAAAQKDSANLKTTISGLKIQNENAVSYYSQKSSDLKSGKAVNSQISTKESILGGLSKAGGISKNDGDEDSDSVSGLSVKGELAGYKKKENKFGAGGISSGKNNSLTGKTGSTDDDSSGNNSREGGSEDGTDSGKSKSAKVKPSEALALLKARLKLLNDDSSGGALVEGAELQRLIEMIEEGKLTNIEEDKLLAYLNSKPEFHLDEGDTRAAIRDLIGEFEQSQLQAFLFETDLFTRVKETYVRSVKNGKVKKSK